MHDPLVSIIIPVYNAESYLAETIESALAQTLIDKEIIIIDDGSTDGSLAIARSYCGGMVKVLAQKNQGAGAARNKGLAEATGRYIQFLDADDLLSPDKIAAQLAVMDGREDVLCITDSYYFKNTIAHSIAAPSDQWFKQNSDIPSDFLLKLYADDDTLPGYGGMITIHAWLTPSCLIAQAGGFSNLLSVDDDGEFFCRVVLQSKGILYSEQGNAYYRKYDNNNSLSAQKTSRAYRSRLDAIYLKYDHLKIHTTSPLLNMIFARHYWEIGVDSFPADKKISKKSISEAIRLGLTTRHYRAGKLSSFLSRFLGWKLMRYLSYYRHGF